MRAADAPIEPRGLGLDRRRPDHRRLAERADTLAPAAPRPAQPVGRGPPSAGRGRRAPREHATTPLGERAHSRRPSTSAASGAVPPCAWSALGWSTLGPLVREPDSPRAPTSAVAATAPPAPPRSCSPRRWGSRPRRHRARRPRRAPRRRRRPHRAMPQRERPPASSQDLEKFGLIQITNYRRIDARVDDPRCPRPERRSGLLWLRPRSARRDGSWCSPADRISERFAQQRRWRS